MGRPRDQRTPGGGVLLKKGLIFDPRFQSGIVLIPFQFLLALDIKPAGFFMPRLIVKRGKQLRLHACKSD